MAFVVADRVRASTTTTGTGTITLGAVPSTFQSFTAIGDGNVTYYSIVSQTANEWEVGIGTYTASGTTLSRSTVLSSSNSGSLVNFSAGTKDVFVTLPASRAVLQDNSGNVGIGTSSPGNLLEVNRSQNADTSIRIINTNAGASARANLTMGGQASTYQIAVNNTYVQNYSAEPLQYQWWSTNSQRMTLDSSGNLGIGVTPSAWNGAYKGLTVGGSGGNGITLAGNDASIGTGYYLSGLGAYAYDNTGATASMINMYNRAFVFKTAAAGTAGSPITWTTAMQLSADGTLNVFGPATGRTAVMETTNYAGIGFRSTAAGTNAKVGQMYFYSGGFNLSFVDDALSAENTILFASRSGYNVTNIFYGNAANNPNHVVYGNMGVGLSPSVKLEAMGTIRSTSTTTDTVLSLTGDNGGFGFIDLYRGTGAYLAVRVSTPTGSVVERLGIDTNGNVGISVTPLVKLHVQSDDNSGALFLRGADPAAGVSAAYIQTPVNSGYSLNAVYSFWYQSGTGIANPAANVIAFNTNGSQRAQFDSSGHLYIGTTSPATTANGFKVFQDGSFRSVQTSGTGAAIYNKTSYTAGTEYFADFRLADSTVGTITASGSTTAYNTTSDLRLKDNIAPADDAGGVIDAIQIVQHDWKRGGHVRYGVIAQDLNIIAPEAVTAGDDGASVVRPWGVDYSKLVPILVKEIQSLRARVAALEGT